MTGTAYQEPPPVPPTLSQDGVPLPDAPKPKRDSMASRPGRLFRATEPVVMWLEGDFKTVFKDRDSMSTKRYPATIRYLGEKGDTVALDVQVSTRGHYRLRSSTCSFAPGQRPPPTSSWTWMSPTTRCMGISRCRPTTATTGSTSTCRC